MTPPPPATLPPSLAFSLIPCDPHALAWRPRPRACRSPSAAKWKDELAAFRDDARLGINADTGAQTPDKKSIGEAIAVGPSHDAGPSSGTGSASDSGRFLSPKEMVESFAGGISSFFNSAAPAAPLVQAADAKAAAAGVVGAARGDGARAA